MKRWTITLVFALMVGGCIVDDGTGSGGYYGPGYSCQQYATCGACTPVPGCGWCTIGGQGWCVADPDQCASAPEFQWTWVPSGCPANPDAAGADGPGGADGGSADQGGDAGTAD